MFTIIRTGEECRLATHTDSIDGETKLYLQTSIIEGVDYPENTHLLNYLAHRDMVFAVDDFDSFALGYNKVIQII